MDRKLNVSDQSKSLLVEAARKIIVRENNIKYSKTEKGTNENLLAIDSIPVRIV